MLDNLMVERFREGHDNVELKKHLCLYPSTGLQDLIGACVCFETHVELGARAYKSNEGLYTVQGNIIIPQILPWMRSRAPHGNWATRYAHG